MYIMGVDPGTKQMGVSITNGNRVIYKKLIKSNCRNIDERLEHISGQLELVFQQTKNFSIDHVIMESAYVDTKKGARKDVSEKLGRAQGLVIEKCSRYAIPYSFATPTEIKKGVAHGKASKEEVSKAVKEIFSLNEDMESDVTDSIAASYYYFKLKLD